MKPVLLSTAYLPPISWMTAAVNSVSIGIEIHETYPKQTYRNRCNIATSSGILSLTVPVQRINGNHTKTCDIRIDNSKNWQILHWRSIKTAYNKSPYFLFYCDLIKPFYNKEYKHLIDLNLELITVLLKAFQIRNPEIFYTTQYEIKPDLYDLRNSFHPKIKSGQSENYEFPRYIQAFESKQGYIPDLSIIDLLFNLGPDVASYLADVKHSFKE